MSMWRRRLDELKGGPTRGALAQVVVVAHEGWRAVGRAELGDEGVAHAPRVGLAGGRVGREEDGLDGVRQGRAQKSKESTTSL